MAERIVDFQRTALLLLYDDVEVIHRALVSNQYGLPHNHVSFRICFVSFYGAPAQFKLYGAKTRKKILAALGYYKLKATPLVKLRNLLKLRRA
jgi:hypothetical protein